MEAIGESGATPDTDEFARQFARLQANVEQFIRGKTEVVRMALVCLFAEGHLLVEDVPGVAKTSLARAVARSISGKIRRIQFTPDLLPSDVTGVQTYDLDRKQFTFKEGPVFANIVLGDEINRASPKTQSALLEVMAERQVTVDGFPRRLPRPFLCIATQNPIEHQGTYILPEAQLDRFAMRISVGYPDQDDEVDILGGGLARSSPDQLTTVLTADDMLEMIRAVERIYVSESVRRYIVTVTRATRTVPELRLGVSPRGTIALGVCAQARAASLGRPFVTPDDVKSIAIPVLNHRLILTPEAVVQGAKPEAILRDILSSVRVPRGG